MNYLENLLELDAAAIEGGLRATEARSTPPRDATRLPPETLALLQRALENLCVPMLVTSSLINRLARERHDDAVTAGLANYASIQVDVLPPVFEQLIEERRFLTAAMLISELQARIGLARGMTLTFAAQGADGAGLVQLDALADAWRRACASAGEVIRMALHYSELPDPENRRLLKMLAWLSLAAEGQAPCIDREGELNVPGWAERRDSPRVVVNKSIRLCVDGHDFACTLVDVSETGFKIAGLSGLAAGDDVIVKLTPRQHCAARVAWARGDSAGLKSRDRLSPEDPIFEV